MYMCGIRRLWSASERVNYRHKANTLTAAVKRQLLLAQGGGEKVVILAAKW